MIGNASIPASSILGTLYPQSHSAAGLLICSWKKCGGLPQQRWAGATPASATVSTTTPAGQQRLDTAVAALAASTALQDRREPAAQGLVPEDEAA